MAKMTNAERKLKQSIKLAKTLIETQTYETAKPRRKSVNEEDFNKQVKRIKNAMRRLERQEGYVFTEEFKNILKRPERLTKAHIEKLKSIKPATLRNLSGVMRTGYKEEVQTVFGNTIESEQYVRIDTGETFTEYDKEQRFIDEAEYTIHSWEQSMEDLYKENPKGKHIIEQWFNRIQDKIGDITKIASILKELAHKGWLPTYKMMYNERIALGFIAEFEHRLPEELRMTDKEIRMLNNSLEQSTRSYEMIEGNEDLIKSLLFQNSFGGMVGTKKR